jgi:hypothetical protein
VFIHNAEAGQPKSWFGISYIVNSHTFNSFLRLYAVSESMPVSMRECSTAPPSDVDAQVVSIFTDKSAVTFSVDDQKEEPFSA